MLCNGYLLWFTVPGNFLCLGPDAKLDIIQKYICFLLVILLIIVLFDIASIYLKK